MAANGGRRGDTGGRYDGRSRAHPRPSYNSGRASKRRKKRRRRRRRSILFRPLAYLLMIAAMLVGVSVFFKVSNVIVEGNIKYTSDMIVSATEIRDGDSLFFISSFKTTDKLFKKLPYINEAQIRRKLPDTIIISVQESYPLASVSVSGNYYIIDKNCKVLEKTDYSGSIGTIEVNGIEPILPKIGERIAPGQIKIDYLSELLGMLEDMGLYEDVSKIDVTNMANFTFEYMDRFTVELGKQERLKYKLDKLDTVLEFITSGETGTIIFKNDREPHFIPD